jgi:histidinol-phosphate phosphatase family protein
VSYDVVIPTSGRPSLANLLDSLESGVGPRPDRVIVVEDRDGRGPAWARNRGWREATSEWVAFLDDDVVLPAEWRTRLAEDIADPPAHVVGSQGRVRVPLPEDRRPTDWERNVRGLEHARWATADMAYRRWALAAVGGFDERFERAYREDADIGLRLTAAGLRIDAGGRHVLHPVRPANAAVSLRLQAGNADDAAMRALHGRGWRERAGAPRGRLPAHLATTAAAAAAVGAAVAGHRRAAACAAAAWLGATAEFAARRIAPGPRTPREIATMAWTSALLPPLAVFHRGRGELRHRSARARRPAEAPPAAVLLDRDGTLVDDVPYNGDPDAVRPRPGAREAVERLRAAGVRLAVVSNQSGIARGLVSPEQVRAVNERIEELLGPLGPWMICPHGPDDACRCRKPAPGLIEQASEALGVSAADCVVIGDIGADVAAARAAGARSVLVPTPLTRPDEVASASAVAPSLGTAVDLVLTGRAAA